MGFPSEFIEDLKRQSDIVRVVQDYVELKKKGSNWMGCCPFHREKTPSFSVSPEKDIFFCFGCQKGGSVFSFVMEIEGLSFPDAVRVVADKSGVTVPETVKDGAEDARRHEVETVIQLNTWALEWWRAQLETAEAKAVRDYLDKRGITTATAETFGLGYSPDKWDALSSFLKEKGASQREVEGSGLVVVKEDGRSYDRFRGRLVFPVLDVQGKPIAFSARTLKEGQAKYINSPETVAYVKGSTLFGLHLSKTEIRKQGFAILVEGNLDLITPYQAGVTNVVASLGTALTARQAKLLARFTQKIVLNYDGDQAGIHAAKRAIELLLQEELEVKVLVLPEKLDPDEFIRKHGVSEYRKKRGQAKPHLRFLIDDITKTRDLRRPAEKGKAVEEVLPYISVVKSPVQRRDYFDMAMDALQIRDAVLIRELWQIIKGDKSPLKASTIVRRGGLKPTLAENRLLALLFANRELRCFIVPKLEERDYDGLPTESLFRALVELQGENTEVEFDSVQAKVEDDPLAAEMLPMLLLVGDDSGQSHEQQVVEAGHCFNALRLMGIDRIMEQLQSEISAAERIGDVELQGKLAMRCLELARSRNQHN